MDFSKQQVFCEPILVTAPVARLAYAIVVFHPKRWPVPPDERLRRRLGDKRDSRPPMPGRPVCKNPHFNLAGYSSSHGVEGDSLEPFAPIISELRSRNDEFSPNSAVEEF